MSVYPQENHLVSHLIICRRIMACRANSFSVLVFVMQKKTDVDDSKGYLNKWKLLIPAAPIAGQTDFSKPVRFFYDGNTRISKPGECCTESWLVAGAFDTEDEAVSYKSYLFTKTVRFLLLQTVVSQHISTKSFCFIPELGKYTGTYTDEMLCKKWGITIEEYEYIDSRISDAGGDE